MGKREYTAEEQEAAWQKADVFEGEDPARVRIDNVDGAGVFIHRDKFEYQGRSAGGWEIDSQGRARGKGYKLRAGMKADRLLREEHQRKEAAALMDRCKEQAREAGIPDAWELYLRIVKLEQEVARLKK